MAIAHIPSSDIDTKKWDECLALAHNRVLYAERFYLDKMAANWDALVLDDYDAVMPIPWRKKWGIRYIYQPAFIQQGGVFSKYVLPESTLSDFLLKAAETFKFAEFTGNSGYIFPPSEKYELAFRRNYALSLTMPYDILAQRYDSIAKKNLKRAQNSGLEYKSSTDYDGLIKFYQQQYQSRLTSFHPNDYVNFGQLCRELDAENAVIGRVVYNKDARIIAGAILIRSGNRIYNLISSVNAEGKKSQANYLLYDQLIKEFSAQPLTLDFEGSDVLGIAAFYKRFAPAEEQYQFVRFNKLPVLLKLLKKRFSNV